MKKVIAFHLKAEHFPYQPVEQLQALFSSNGYIPATIAEIPDHLEGEDAAEEVFDLSNNPAREDDRTAYYGSRVRCLCVGDVVSVDGRAFLCKSSGWEELRA